MRMVAPWLLAGVLSAGGGAVAGGSWWAADEPPIYPDVACTAEDEGYLRVVIFREQGVAVFLGTVPRPDPTTMMCWLHEDARLTVREAGRGMNAELVGQPRRQVRYGP